MFINFFDAISALGYAAINIAVLLAFLAAMGFMALGKYLNSLLKKCLYVAVFVLLFVLISSYLGGVNQALTGAYEKTNSQNTSGDN